LSPSAAVANSSAAQLIARIRRQIIDLRRIDEVVCNGMAQTGHTGGFQGVFRVEGRIESAKLAKELDAE
jgi:hypothetical protein